MADKHGQPGTPGTRGAIHEAAEAVEEFRIKGRECAYGNKNGKKFLRKLRQLTDRVHEIKDWYMCRTGRCIDCDNSSHLRHECTPPTSSSCTDGSTGEESCDSSNPPERPGQSALGDQR